MKVLKVPNLAKTTTQKEKAMGQELPLPPDVLSEKDEFKRLIQALDYVVKLNQNAPKGFKFILS